MSTEAPAAEVKPEPAPGAAPAPDVAVPEVPQQPEKTFTQKELDEILEKRLAKERRKREDLRQERDVLRRLTLERSPEPAPRKETPDADREPVRGDFESYEDFIKAQAEHRAGKTARAVIKEDRDQQAKAKQEEESRKSAESFRSKIKENATGIEDFEDVMNSATSDPNSAVARLPADPIAASDNPAKILYHLATHPEEAERIASLPLGQQAREIWKLDSTLSVAKPPVKPSKAPAPIEPVGGSKTVQAGEMPDPTTHQKEWLAWRNAQVRLARTGKAA